jgi:hypothetical protein
MKPYLIGQGVFPFADTSFPCPASQVLSPVDSINPGLAINLAFLS